MPQQVSKPTSGSARRKQPDSRHFFPFLSQAAAGKCEPHDLGGVVSSGRTHWRERLKAAFSLPGYRFTVPFSTSFSTSSQAFSL
jgi:hypothetical protein